MDFIDESFGAQTTPVTMNDLVATPIAPSLPMGAIRNRLYVLEQAACTETAPTALDTIAVPVKTLRAWRAMARQLACEIELEGDINAVWIYNVGQAYADANVLSSELADVLSAVEED